MKKEKRMEIKNFRAIHDKEYILELIEEGEHEMQDFKFSISDSRKIARSISAFANHSGGRLLVGVKDNGNIAGIRSEEEFYMIEQAAEMYCKPAQTVSQRLYCADGKYVLLVEIQPADSRPVMAQDDNHTWQSYYRIADENIVAPKLLTRVWKAKKEEGVLFAYSETESRVLNFVSEKVSVTLENIMLSCHLSKKMAENIVIFLCSMGLLEFKYGQHENLQLRLKKLEDSKKAIARIFGLGKSSKAKPGPLLEVARDLYDKMTAELSSNNIFGDDD